MQTTIITPIIPNIAVPTARIVPTVPGTILENFNNLPIITPLGNKTVALIPTIVPPVTPLVPVVPKPPTVVPPVTPLVPVVPKPPTVVPEIPKTVITQEVWPNHNAAPRHVFQINMARGALGIPVEKFQAIPPTMIGTPEGNNVGIVKPLVTGLANAIQPRVPVIAVTNMVPILPPVVAEPQVKDLTLMPWQVNWAQRAHNILLRNHGYIDTSRMRSGKTYVNLWLAKQFGFRLLIVCPVIAIDVWRRTAAEYGVEVIDVISYQSLRSQKGHQPKHGYLDRHDNVTEGGIHQIHFTATRAYTNLVNQGIMVICDEIQNIKNNSAQYKACNALIRPIITAGGRSRFGLLSGTPFDKEEHAVNLLKLIGYIRAHRLYNYIRETKELVLEGIQELIDACRFIDNNETERVLAEIPLVRGKMNHLCYSLYTRVVKESISGAMAAPTDITGTFDVKNGFYNMTAGRGEELRAAIDELAAAVRFNERTGTAEIRADNIGAVTTALVHIENAKGDDFARVATEILMQDKRNKVIISVNYTSTIEGIRNLMLFFNPLILNGQVPAQKRAPIVRAFNENPDARLLIMNTSVGGVGISLYAPGQGSPRFMLMSPSYKLLEVTQAAARVYGPGMDTDAVVRMFYGKGNGGLETNILTAMARKTQVLKGTLDDIVKRDLILPGDYRAEEERDI
ncbi:Hypothetical protein HVR_LOCUS105 [uncultured virus]|nr:Hypothetical protein HVR_LOCUS105 [uncultured virus]